MLLIHNPQLWRSVRDFLEQSRAWTEEPILDDDGQVLLNVEAVHSEVEDYTSKAYKASKTYKDVRRPKWRLYVSLRCHLCHQRSAMSLHVLVRAGCSSREAQGRCG